MRILLDTHILLWWLDAPERLPERARHQIADSANDVFVSVVSIWEVAIKQSIDKLDPSPEFQQVIESGLFPILPVELAHAFRVRTLPLFHRDPFDRMLLAQALTENLTLITNDAALKCYNVPIVLA